MQRTLTHKGVELDGLLYNCDELQALRTRNRVKLTVNLRVDVDDIGHIFVLPPEPAAPILVPALDVGYARGISQWQHQQFRNYARNNQHDDDALAWLRAKAELAERIREELADRHKKSRKRVARHLENMRLPEGTASDVADRSDLNRDFTPAVPAQPDIDESIFSDVASNINGVAKKRFTAIIEEEPPHGKSSPIS